MCARTAVFAFSLWLTVFWACGTPKNDGSDQLSKDKILFEVNQKLSSGDCSGAISIIDPVYNSTYSDNDFRLARASAYACVGNVNFFKNLGQFAAAASDITPTGIWGKVLAKTFPSSGGDDRVDGASSAMDTLLAVVKPGWVISSSNKVVLNSYNTGSTNYNERTFEANMYMLWVASATVGAILNRYGNPNNEYSQTTNLPWTAVANVTTVGCTFAAGIFNMFDAANAIVDEAAGTATVKSIASSIAVIKTSFNDQCTTDCGSSCGDAMRDRTTCDSTVATDSEACWASSITKVVNALWQ